VVAEPAPFPPTEPPAEEPVVAEPAPFPPTEPPAEEPVVEPLPETPGPSYARSTEERWQMVLDKLDLIIALLEERVG